MLTINSNGSKWYGEQPDSIDKLIEVLGQHTLDPRFEKHGNFIYKPYHAKRDEQGEFVDDLDKPIFPDHPDAVNIWGNFLEVSHVFNIHTDEPVVIDRLSAAIRANQATPAYQQARKERGL